jgi:hypothetical protein
MPRSIYFSAVKRLVNGDDFFYLWDFFPQQPFDAHFEGHFCARAAGAGALKADLDGRALFGGDEFDIPAVALKVGPYGIDYYFDLLLKGIISFAVVAAALFAHIQSPNIY